MPTENSPDAVDKRTGAPTARWLVWLLKGLAWMGGTLVALVPALLLLTVWLLRRRRRQCGHCAKRFTTYERPDVSFPSIVKKDGRRVPYSKPKLQGSLDLALRKRPVSTEQIDERFEEIVDFAGPQVRAGLDGFAENPWAAHPLFPLSGAPL